MAFAEKALTPGRIEVLRDGKFSIERTTTQLEDKVAIVTGSSLGIGRAVAVAREGPRWP